MPQVLARTIQAEKSAPTKKARKSGKHKPGAKRKRPTAEERREERRRRAKFLKQILTQMSTASDDMRHLRSVIDEQKELLDAACAQADVASAEVARLRDEVLRLQEVVDIEQRRRLECEGELANMRARDSGRRGRGHPLLDLLG